MARESPTRHTDGEEEIGRESDGAAADYPDRERKLPALEWRARVVEKIPGIYITGSPPLQVSKP
jgi:hypothetical protein